MNSNRSTPMCILHDDEVAKAMCMKNKQLLCFTCIVEKAKSGNCTIKDIDKLSNDNEKLLLDVLLMSQAISRKQKLLEEYKTKAEKVKENLKREVNELYENLAQRLTEMKENTITSIEQCDVQDCDSDQTKLISLQKEISEILNRLPEAVSGGIESCKSKLQEVDTTLNEKIADRDANLEGLFEADTIFVTFDENTRDTLGNVQIYNSNLYDKPIQDNTEDVKVNDSYEKPIVTSGTDDRYVGSDADAPLIPPRLNPQNPDTSGKPTPVERNVKRTSKHDDVEESCESKQEDSKGLAKKRTLGRFLSRDKKSDEKEVYGDFKFVDSRKQTKELVNKTLSVSGLSFKSACKFSKLVPIGVDRLGLLSAAHSTVLVTDFDGTVVASQEYSKGVTSIAAIENGQLAVLTLKDRPQIQKVSGDTFEPEISIDLKYDISGVTGFDYFNSKGKSRFAITTCSKLIICDAKGKKIKQTEIEKVTGSSDIATTYDVEHDFLYVLNKSQKTFKCISLKKMGAVWKRKCEDQSNEPNSICLYREKLCIASLSTITIFETKEGQPIRKINTSASVKNCLGMCVMDDVIVVSSDSDAFDESTKLAFFSL